MPMNLSLYFSQAKILFNYYGYIDKDCYKYDKYDVILVSLWTADPPT